LRRLAQRPPSPVAGKAQAGRSPPLARLVDPAYLSGVMATSKARPEAAAERSRLVVAVIAAVVGLGGGLVFGEPVLSLFESVWTDFLLPAYLEIQRSGIPFCG
jgi:hypothetical protein